MSLTSAMNTAQSIFNNTGKQSDVISKNIANVGNANYVKRTAILGTTMNGANIVTMGRAQDESLLRQTIASSSLFSAQSTVLKGFEDIKSIFGGDNEAAPSAYLKKLVESLDTYAAGPSSTASAASVVNAAFDVANSLSSASQKLQSIRADADKQIALQVNKLNGLLADFDVANNGVKVATATNSDPSNALDQRETLLKEISAIIGVTAGTRANNDVVLFTLDGNTLFENGPRKVSFSPLPGYDATAVGNSIYVDNVAIKIGAGSNTTATGSLAGLLQVRDDVAPTMQSQLDEIARGVISIFAEQPITQPAPPATPLTAKPGLFTWSTADATSEIPAPGVIVSGLAAGIIVNPKVVIDKGGNPQLIRDGGIAGAEYVKNNPATGGAGYSDLIRSYTNALNAPFTFDEDTRVDTTTSLLQYSTNSIGWLEKERSNATAANEAKKALYERASTSYSNNTAVSLDEELSLLLDIEQSYKAATKLVTTVDEMLDALMQMVR